ncbi:MAG TPA: hypothetical protein VI542_03930, partial [Candidatus Tectomicrobia bacterium]
SIGQVAGGFAPPLGAQPRLQRAARASDQGLLAPQPTLWENLARAVGMGSQGGRAILQGFDQQSQQQLTNRLALRRSQLLEEQEGRQATQEGYKTLVEISKLKNKALRNLQFDRFAAQAAEAGQPLPADFIEAYKKSTLAEGEGIAQAYGPLLEKAGFNREQTARILESGDLDTIKLTFRTPRMVIHVFSQGHFSYAQQTPTVLCCRRMRGATPHPIVSGAWHGSRSTAHRSVPSPTSAHCEGLCGQDRLGRGD